MQSGTGGAVAVLTTLTFGCGSSYVPAQSPRVSVVMDGGTQAYVRDGKKFEGGLFGGELDEAVRGNPQAEAYARQYKTGTATGFALTLVGLAGVVGGAAVIGAEAGNGAGHSAGTSQTISTPGLVLLGAGLVMEIVGLVVELSAVPHLYDAVNAYNDALR